MSQNLSASRNSRILVLLLGFSAVVALLIFSFIGWKALFSKVLETNPPVISFLSKNSVIGATHRKFSINVSDLGAGLHKISAHAVSSDKELPLIQETYLSGKEEQQINLFFAGSDRSVTAKSIIPEGQFHLKISAVDEAIFHNSSTKVIEMRADYTAPVIEFVYVPEVVLQGSTAFMFFKVKENNFSPSSDEELHHVSDQLRFVGLEIGDAWIRAFPAMNLDRVFEDRNLFVAIVPIPMDKDIEQLSTSIIAEDLAGNGVRESVEWRIEERARILKKTNITPSIFTEKISLPIKRAVELYPHYFNILDLDSSITKGELTNSSESYKNLLKALVSHVEPLTQSLIRGILNLRHSERWWTGNFISPTGTKVENFGTLNQYKRLGKIHGQLPENGITVLTSPEGRVVALQDGVVSYLGPCGHYGHCIALNHGLGVASLYYNIRSLKVEVGDRIAKGELIASAKKSPFSDSFREPRFYSVQIRIQGVAVEPTDWSDEEWYRSNVVGAVEQAKQTLGLSLGSS